jgi:hypothetical protein
MALSFSAVDWAGVSGTQRKTVTNVTFDSSYLSGGETVTAAQLGLSSLDYGTCQIKAVGGTVNVASAFLECVADPAANKIHLWDETPAEVTSTADVSGIVVQVTAFGH